MIKINFLNIEKLIFEDPEVQNILPAYTFSYFEQWKLGKRVPFLKQTSRQAMLDLLENLSSHTDILEEYFDETVIIETLNHHAVWNFKIPIDDQKSFCEQLCQMEGYPNYSIWRDSDFIYVSLWR